MSNRIMDQLDLPGEPMPGQPVVEMVGTERVLIEHHGGVTEYGSNRIRVKVSYGAVCVSGEGLELKRMTRHQLVIGGKIDCVALERVRHR